MAGHIAMSDGLIRLSTDWADVFRARIVDLGLSNLEVDERAGLPEGYCNKILNGKKKPGAVTIARLCGALQLAFRPVVDAEPGQR
jgi:predicted transcriptional regulator